ncbi:MAG: glutaredoxin family protein [Arthrobacter sp.]|jgi:glutaredoxin|nr:glutaredoxin family protein [Arthrobacter sp.]
MSDAQVTLYGADWCRDCLRSKKLLDKLEVPFNYIDLVATPEASDDAERISGRKNIPVVVLPDGSHLVEPTDEELRVKLKQTGVI